MVHSSNNEEVCQMIISQNAKKKSNQSSKNGEKTVSEKVLEILISYFSLFLILYHLCAEFLET